MRSATTSPTVSALMRRPARPAAPTVAVTTCAPAASVISVSLVTIALPPRARMPVTGDLRGRARRRRRWAGCSGSAARRGACGTARCPESGSASSCCSVCSGTTMANVGRRDDVGVAEGAGGARDRCAAGRPRTRRERTRAPSRGRRRRGPSAGTRGRRDRGSLAPCHPTERGAASPGAVAQRPLAAQGAQRHLARDHGEEHGEEDVGRERDRRASRSTRRAQSSCMPRRR